jgi:hypothetical protein
MTNGVPSQVGCQHVEGPLATWTRDSWHGESMGKRDRRTPLLCWLEAIMARKQLSLAFWRERRKSRNNGNITDDPNYKRYRNPKLKQVYHHK